jgi:hypothetical protein
MKFVIEIKNENIVSISRRIGYRPMSINGQREYSIIRLLTGNNYPRFHIYIKEEKTGDFIFNLHLDQKKPSYGSTHAHSAEYEGDLIDKEVERIKKLIEQII